MPEQPSPRIAVASYEVYEHAGAERVLVETIRRTQGRISWLVASRSFPSELAGVVDWLRVRSPARPYRLKLPVFGLAAAARLARAKADLLHSIGPILPLRPDLVTVHFLRAAFYEAIDAPRRPATAAHVSLEAWFLSRARALAAPSLWMRGELERRFPHSPVHLTPNGVDLDRFRPAAATRAETRAELGVTDDTFVGAFVGNSAARKGLDVAIEALALVRRRGVDAELWACGLGPGERDRRHAAELGVAPSVRLLGVRRDVERVYQAADAFVFPSAYEIFPLVALEAAASGLPLLMPRVGGAEELVGEDEGGLIVERTAASVADAMTALAGDPARRQSLGAQAAERASAYTWERAIEALLAVYEELLERKTS